MVIVNDQSLVWQSGMHGAKTESWGKYALQNRGGRVRICMLGEDASEVIISVLYRELALDVRYPLS